MGIEGVISVFKNIYHRGGTTASFKKSNAVIQELCLGKKLFS